MLIEAGNYNVRFLHIIKFDNPIVLIPMQRKIFAILKSKIRTHLIRDVYVLFPVQFDILDFICEEFRDLDILSVNTVIILGKSKVRKKYPFEAISRPLA